MKNKTKLKLFLSALVMCTVGIASPVSAEVVDPEKLLTDLGKIYEANIINQKYGTSFIPNDKMQRQWSDAAVDYVYMYPVPTHGKVGYVDDYVAKSYDVTLSDVPIARDTESLHYGINTFDNRQSPVTQYFLTDQFTKSIAETTTSTTTHGFKGGTTAKASFGVPGIGGTDITVNLEYTMSKAGTNSKTQTFTYTSPSQKIEVPAGKKWRVLTSLDTVKVTGDVNLLATVDATINRDISYENNPGMHKKCYEYSPAKNRLYSAITNGWWSDKRLELVNGNVTATDSGTFTSTSGTQLSVQIIDVTNAESDADSGPIVKEFKVPVTKTGNQLITLINKSPFELN